MTNPFMTKVHLAQKWHTDTSKDLSDPNDIAELVLDTWQAAEDYAIKAVKDHQMTNVSTGGFLRVCTCGEGVDDYVEHLVAFISGDN